MTETNPRRSTPDVNAAIAKSDHVAPAWDRLMLRVRQEIARRQVHPAATVMLLPYAQLIAVARAAWTRGGEVSQSQAHFVPRFETSMNWCRALGAFAPTQDDLRLDAARDLLSAASLLERAGLRAQRDALAATLMQAAWSLAGVAAAVPTDARAEWGLRMAAALDAQAPAPLLALEAQLGRIALAWAANSAYATDSIFSTRVELLVLLEGLQDDPLHTALRSHWGERVLGVQLDGARTRGTVCLHRAQDPEDEAQRAAASVLAHLACARVPVALVAQDRVLTRRVGALLALRAVAVRDETGWTLSTTRAAAAIMVMLRAMAWNASTDTVLDWAKNVPAFDPGDVARLEAALRRDGARDWRRSRIDDQLLHRIQATREDWQSPRSLVQWLGALRAVLQSTGQWPQLLRDTAGQAAIDALHLGQRPGDNFGDVAQRFGQSAFVAWVSQALESGSFVPPHPVQAEVVILPASQLLGRSVQAVVFPGCDEIHLGLSAQASGIWTPAQRVVLGLPSRDQLAATLEAAWQIALSAPHTDVMWRASDGGELRMASALVQQLRLRSPAATTEGADARVARSLVPRPCTMPRPTAAQLPLTELSASAYEDLRRCPYRFFALRQLGLRSSDELDTELDKRDFGNWLHLLLRYFHQELLATPVSDIASRLAMMDAAAERARAELTLAQDEFLPFSASWPQLRLAYLQWLATHEATGAKFLQAEAAKRVPLGKLTLIGRIDRIDQLGDGSRLVIDYKTEARSTTAQRIRDPSEDSQLAFYAALLDDDVLSALYLHIAESESTRAFRQPDIGVWRDRLLDAIQGDMARIADGAALAALGSGAACAHCDARGLCRKDFWQPEVDSALEPRHD